MTLIWPFKVTQGQTEYAIPFASYHSLYVFCSNYSAISHGNPVFSRWPWSGFPRSPKVKLIIPSDSRHIISYTCVIVTLALSRTETLFFSRCPRSGLSRSPKVKLNIPSDSRHIISYTCFIVTLALSRTEPLVIQQMALIWPFKVTKGLTDNTIGFAPNHFLYVFHSNYSAISPGTPVLFFSRWPRSVLSFTKRKVIIRRLVDEMVWNF